MKHQQHFRKERGIARWQIVALLAVWAGSIVWMLVQSIPSIAVRKQQAALLYGIESRNAAKVSKLISESYADRWEFSRIDLVETTKDVGSQFLVMMVTGEEVSFEKKGNTVIIKTKLALGGKPLGAFGNEITRRVNSLKEPFTFTWVKEGFLPSSWRLVKMDNPEIPANLYGYTPGSLREMMDEL